MKKVIFTLIFALIAVFASAQCSAPVFGTGQFKPKKDGQVFKIYFQPMNQFVDYVDVTYSNDNGTTWVESSTLKCMPATHQGGYSHIGLYSTMGINNNAKVKLRFHCNSNSLQECAGDNSVSSYSQELIVKF